MNTCVPTIAVGIDNGNSYFTLVHIQDNGEYRRIVFPNAVEQGSVEEIARLDRLFDRAQILPTDSLGKTDHVLEYNNQTWFVGERAFRGPKGGTNDGSKERYWSLESKISTLAGIAASLPSDVTQCRVVAVTCLPLKMTMDKEAVRRVKNNLNGGPYHIAYNGRTICIQELRVGKIIAEGISPAIRHNPPEDQDCAVIDIGYFTTDPVTVRGLKAINGDTIEIAVSDVAKYVAKEAERIYGRELTQADTEDILRAYIAIHRYRKDHDDLNLEEILNRKQEDHQDMPGYPHIATNSTKGPISTEDMERWVAAGCANTSAKITAKLAKMFKSENDGYIGSHISKFYLVGGGAYFFKDALRRVIVRHKMEMSDQPEFDNADGLAYVARVLVSRNQEVSQVL
jgi:hypothetical protein